jgi:hypothetical protein
MGAQGAGRNFASQNCCRGIAEQSPGPLGRKGLQRKSFFAPCAKKIGAESPVFCAAKNAPIWPEKVDEAALQGVLTKLSGSGMDVSTITP